MFREAVVLHYLDDLDSKMGAIRSLLASEKGEGEWSDWSAALDRRLLRVEEFWKRDTAAGAPPDPAQPGLFSESRGSSKVKEK